MATPGGGPPPPGGNPIIIHIYAAFTDPADRVLTWGIGGAQLGPGGIENTNALGTGPGSGFINVGAPSANSPPSVPGTPRDWDTYATLGVRYLNQLPAGADAPAYSPGFPPFITGTELTVPPSGMAVFITPAAVNTHGRADFIVEGPDTANRVLFMQLVMNFGERVHGTIGVVWDGAGAPDGTVASGLTFDVPSVPAPSGLPLLALVALVGPRRRRG